MRFEWMPFWIYTIDAILFLCLIIQTFQSINRRSKSDYQKKLSNYKLSIFSLAFLCLAIKFVSQTVVTFDYYTWEPNAEIAIAFISQTLPSFLIITITSIISRFWYEIVSYMSFIEYGIDQIELFNQQFKGRLIRYNILLYVYYIIMSALSFFFDSENIMASLIIVMSVAYLLANTVMIYYGVRVYLQIFRNHDHGSHTVKSFLFNLIMTGICFLIKIGADITLIVDAFELDFHVGLIFLDTCEEIADGGAWTLLGYIVGQFGSFFCLIMLLNKHAENSKRSFTTRSMSNLSEGVYDRDEQYLPKDIDHNFFEGASIESDIHTTNNNHNNAQSQSSYYKIDISNAKQLRAAANESDIRSISMSSSYKDFGLNNNNM